MDRRLALLLLAAGLAAPRVALAHEEKRHPLLRPAQPGPQQWSRGNRGWWRGRAEWRDYKGERPGFWYAPGYGYYPVDPALWRHRWRRGEYRCPRPTVIAWSATGAWFENAAAARCSMPGVWCGRQIAPWSAKARA